MEMRPRSPAGFSKASHYGVHSETERLDYDAIRDMARKIRPGMIVAGASSYPRLIDYQALRSIADESRPISWWTWPTSQGS